MHAVDAAVGEEVEEGDVAGEGGQAGPLGRRHVVPGPVWVELHLLPGRGVLLAAFLRQGERQILSIYVRYVQPS